MLTVSFARIARALRVLPVVALVSSLLWVPAARADSTKTWDNISTGLVVGLGAAAVTATMHKFDDQGVKQGLLTAGATLVTVEALKALVDEPRPDGSDNKSFPSGHTALAFAAATYFDVRYGDEYKQFVPVMYGLAALTGVARVKARKHYAKDVLAGAVIGWGMAQAFTTPLSNQLLVAPTNDGMAFMYTRHF